jgi:hypothetical protein
MGTKSLIVVVIANSSMHHWIFAITPNKREKRQTQEIMIPVMMIAEAVLGFTLLVSVISTNEKPFFNRVLAN